MGIAIENLKEAEKQKELMSFNINYAEIIRRNPKKIQS